MVKGNNLPSGSYYWYDALSLTSVIFEIHFWIWYRSNKKSWELPSAANSQPVKKKNLEAEFYSVQQLSTGIHSVPFILSVNRPQDIMTRKVFVGL